MNSGMKPILVVGAGPCGLGAAWALHSLGHDDWELCEANDYAGGLSASFVDPLGFTWDVGGHVLFTKHEKFAGLVRNLLAGEFHEHQRSAWVRLCAPAAWVPYPYQDNLHFLPEAMRQEALAGLDRRVAGNPQNFAEWIDAHFGDGIARQFMLPYNRKVWGTDPREMDFHWIADRVKTIDAEELKRVRPGDPPRGGWGPNATFIFPRSGGTGEIFRRLAVPLNPRIRYNAKLVALDAKRKVATFSDGRKIEYRALITTVRLDELLGLLPGLGVSAPLRAVGGAVVGIGVEHREASGKCWSYFPDNPPGFYRLTWFHHYAAGNVPDGNAGRYAAYMVETVLPPGQTVDRAALLDAAVAGLRRAGILAEGDEQKIVSRWFWPVPAIYPVPVLGLREALPCVHAALEALSIYSRGRFGGWRYELGNMDHCFMQGYECARRLIEGGREPVWHS